MNVSIRKLIFLHLILLIPWVASAQLERYDVLPNETFTYEVYAEINVLDVRSDVLGYLQAYPSGGNFFSIDYKPKPGFFGIDVIHIEYMSGPGFQRQYKDVEIEVKKSRIGAESDYAVVPLGVEGIEIDVLANDWGSRGNLGLSGITVVNNGEAFIEGDMVFFLPDEGFEGVASFNYIVCDDVETCATGVVTVLVEGNMLTNEDQILSIITSRNTPISIPLPFTFEAIDSEPANGSLDSSNESVIVYTPGNGYFGDDEFVLAGYTSNGVLVTLTVEVDVLFKEDPNGIAFDDFAYTSLNTPVEINVLQNDIGEYAVNSFTQPSDGTVERIGSSGRFIFTPNENFAGRASFSYGVRSPSGFGEIERATVHVIVKNQVPSSTAKLKTYKNLPLKISIIGSPISNFEFKTIKAPAFGTLKYFKDFTIYDSHLGFTYEGENFMLYEPNFDFYGTDEFEVEHCVNGSCNLIKIIVEVKNETLPGTIVCVEECVWPGDANNDGTVNMGDLLQVGQVFGIRGPEREDKNPDWYAHKGENWNNPYTRSAVDLKYADTDGSGLVESLDTNCISHAYGLQHSLTPPAESFLLNLPFYLQPTFTSVNPGDVLEFNILIGTKLNPAFDLYGFQFDFKVEDNFAKPNTLEVEFGKDAWTAFGSPVLHMTKKQGINKVEAGYTRTNGVAKDGYGIIGKLRFVVEDDINGFRIGDKPTITIQMSSAGGMLGSGQTFESGGTTLEIPIDLEAPEELTADQLHVYPNPAKDWMNVHLNGEEEIEQILIYNITGQEVFNSGSIQVDRDQVNVKDLATGTYIMRARTTSGVVTKKFEVVKE